MQRVVSLFLPSWSTDRLRRKLGDVSPPPDRPLVLVGQQGNRRLVVATDRAAVEAGLRVGMPATKAQALIQGLAVMEAEPDADAEALERLALWALRRYAPIVAPDPPDGLVMDTTGADHLHGGEQLMLADMVERLSQVGFSARAAIADSWGALGCCSCGGAIRQANRQRGRRQCNRRRHSSSAHRGTAVGRGGRTLRYRRRVSATAGAAARFRPSFCWRIFRPRHWRGRGPRPKNGSNEKLMILE